MVLAMLASGATDNSTTQEQLLSALGRSRNIQKLEQKYPDLLEEYEVQTDRQTDIKYCSHLSNHFHMRIIFFMHVELVGKKLNYEAIKKVKQDEGGKQQVLLPPINQPSILHGRRSFVTLILPSFCSSCLLPSLFLLSVSNLGMNIEWDPDKT